MNNYSMSGRRFLITGGLSLIGSRIAILLLERGVREIVLVDNMSLESAHSSNPLLSDPRVRFVRGDILDTPTLTSASEGIDGIFALAAFLTLPLGENPRLGLQVNVQGMISTLDAAVAANVPRVTMASSISVYGDNLDGSITEDFAFGSTSLSPPFALYALSKLVGEQLGRLYQQRHGIHFSAARFSTVYGIGQHDRGVNALQILQTRESVLQGKNPVILGSGADAHDFIYVDDAASGIISALENGKSGSSYTIATGTTTTTTELVKAVLRVMDSGLEPVYVADERAARPALHPALNLDVSRAASELQWRASVDLEDGLARTVRWFSERETAAR